MLTVNTPNPLVSLHVHLAPKIDTIKPYLCTSFGQDDNQIIREIIWNLRLEFMRGICLAISRYPGPQLKMYLHSF